MLNKYINFPNLSSTFKKIFKEKNIFYFLIILFIFICGILLRLKYYFETRHLWGDEVSLILNILEKNYFEYTVKLGYNQIAPPLFLALADLSVKIFGVNEYSMRLIPLFASITSVFAFYILTKRVFLNRISIVAANILFAINIELIYYSQEFKQYSIEMLVLLLVFLILGKAEFGKQSYKKIFIYIPFILIACFSSHTAIIAVGAVILSELFTVNKINIKKTLIFSMSMILTLLIPFCIYFSLKNTANNMFGDYLTYNILYDKIILLNNFAYIFQPNEFFALHIILLVTGFILLTIDKKILSKSIIFVLLIDLTGSLLKLYPYDERLMLYSFPVIICLFVKPLDLISFKNFMRTILSIILVGIFLFSFKEYLSLNFIKNIYYFNNSYALSSRIELGNYSTELTDKKVIKIIFDGFKDDDIFLCASGSLKFIRFYSFYYKDKEIFNLLNKNKIDLPLINNYSDELKNLKKHSTYWLLCETMGENKKIEAVFNDIEKLHGKSIEKYMTPNMLLIKFNL